MLSLRSEDTLLRSRFLVSTNRWHALTNPLPDTVLCPVCQKQVFSQKINGHLDSNCKRYLAEGPNASGPTAESSKSKQKQRWDQLFSSSSGSGGSGASAKGKDRGKGKSR